MSDWNGKLQCADCDRHATHMVKASTRQGEHVWEPVCGACEHHARTECDANTEPLPDLAALRRDSAQLAKVREIAERWHKVVTEEHHKPCEVGEDAFMQICAALGLDLGGYVD